MRVIKYVAIVAVVAGLSFFAPSPAKAQVSLSFGMNVGPQPVCPYGYFDYTPYNCAPYGYYGPEWFRNGFFIGAGPWFRGPRDWHGHVDDDFDPRYGYRGEFPHRGDDDRFRGYGHGHEFHGNSMRGGYGYHGDRGYHGDHGNHGYQGDRGNHGDHGDHH